MNLDVFPLIYFLISLFFSFYRICLLPPSLIPKYFFCDVIVNGIVFVIPFSYFPPQLPLAVCKMLQEHM